MTVSAAYASMCSAAWACVDLRFSKGSTSTEYLAARAALLEAKAVWLKAVASDA